MIYVRLQPNWNGTFQRTIRDKDKKVLNVRTFAPGEVIGLPPEELPGLRRDLGNAIQPMEWSDDHGKFRPIDVKEIDLDGLIDSIENGTYRDVPDPLPPENVDRIPVRRRHPAWMKPQPAPEAVTQPVTDGANAGTPTPSQVTETGPVITDVPPVAETPPAEAPKPQRGKKKDDQPAEAVTDGANAG